MVKMGAMSKRAASRAQVFRMVFRTKKSNGGHLMKIITVDDFRHTLLLGSTKIMIINVKKIDDFV